MTQVSFDELLAGCRRSAVKLEMRDSYMVTDSAYLGWRSGEPVHKLAERYADWAALVRATVARGAVVRRVRVVSEPVSDYVRFEHALTPAVSLSGGEEIRWLGRQRTVGLLFPAGDVWVIDDQVVLFLYFSGDGDLVSSDLIDDPQMATACASAFAAAWERGTDHAEYQV